MTTSRADELRRQPGQPYQATFLELFFDLAFIFAFTQLSRVLIQDLRWSGAFQTLLLLLTLSWVWAFTAGLTDRYNPQRPAIQLLVIASLIGTLVMASALPEAFGAQGLIFVGAYVATQISHDIIFVFLLRGEEQRSAARVLFWSALSAVPWIAGALAHDTARATLWAVAATLDYLAAVLRWPTPKLGPSPRSNLPSIAEHLAERYRQFLIVALGELILISGIAFHGRFQTARTGAFVVSILTTVLLWRIYIYRAGELSAAAIAASHRPGQLAQSALYGHLFMVAGIVVTGVGAELVITRPTGNTPPAWVAVILGGPALFLIGRSRFEYAVFARVSVDRVIGVLVLAALTPAMLFIPPLAVAAAAVGVLLGIAVADAARGRRQPDELPSPPQDRPS